MPVLSTQDITKEFGGHLLFSGLTISFDARARVGLIGRNGAGKSTLLKILTGQEPTDSGTVTKARELRVGLLQQMDHFPDQEASVREFLEKSFQGTDITAQTILANKALSLLGFEDPHVSVGVLSGGWKKRLSLAKLVAGEPDFLLLDEPSNHLDFAGFEWLDTLLRRFQGGFIMSSHDRALLNRHCTSIVEIADWYPDGYLRAEGNYDDFLEHREAFFEAQVAQSQSLNNRAAREQDWLRAGVKARTTKSNARKDAAHELIEEAQAVKRRLAARQNRAHALKKLQGSQRKTKELVKIENVSKSVDQRPLFSNVQLTLSPGHCLAVVGPNGSGKSTFLKLLMGNVPCEAGSITHAPSLKIAYFSQSRERLDLQATLKTALCPEGDALSLGERRIHVTSWARQLGFSVDQLATTVGSLSGGEQARVALSEVIVAQADLLILDEPTNDLDIATLEILEEALVAFSGAIAIVSHDRYLLATLPTHLLALDGSGGNMIVASYDQWQKLQKTKNKGKETRQKADKAEVKQNIPRIRLSWQEKKELESIQTDIEKAEAQAEKLQRILLDPKVSGDSKRLQQVTTELTEQDEKVRRLFARWEELDEKQKVELASKGSNRK